MPLRGRPLFTLRALWHANSARLPYRFIIADGLVRPGLAAILDRARDLFPNVDIEYIRYADDAGYRQFFAKMSDALARVGTRYAMIADNDDFLMGSGIARSIDFLDANPDYVCAGGGVSGFSVYSPREDALSGVVGSFNRFAFRYAPADRSIDLGSPSIMERLQVGMRTSFNYYSVFRSAELAKIHREAREIDFSDLQLHERFCNIRALTLGKSRSDPSAISYMRQYGTSLGMALAKDWVHHLVRSRFNTDFAKMIERISQVVAADEGGQPSEIAEQLRTGIEPWLRNFLRINYGIGGAIRREVRRKAPALVKWIKTRRRYSVLLERRALFSKLRQSGASAPYLKAFRAELAQIEDVIAGTKFRGFIQPLAGKLADAGS
jgi:glycosyltransferase domain-containing protein